MVRPECQIEYRTKADAYAYQRLGKLDFSVHPINLLDEAIKKYKSDAAISRALGVSDAYLSVVRKGKKKLSPLQAAKLAALVGHNEITWALIALREQAKNKSDAEFWQSLLERK